MSSRVSWLLVAGCLCAANPLDGVAQVLHGRVLDEVSERVIPAASIFLLTSGGEVSVQVESDSLGRFLLRVPEPGDYTIAAERIGYEVARTPLVRIEGDDLPRLDLLMRPQPVGLEGLDVTVGASAIRRELTLYGVNADLLPKSRLVTRDEIIARQAAVDAGAVLSWQNIPGLTVHRPENGLTVPMCVVLAMSRTASGASRCALIVVNGVPDPGAERLVAIHPMDIEAMAVLSPDEASTLYGGDGGGGAVVVFTVGYVR